MTQFKVVVLVGSLRKGSFNLRLARALEKLAQGRAQFDYARLDDVPLYNQDHDGDFPAAGTRLKAQIRAADAVLFVTPEYNRSIPGVLKNAIDTASRPYGDAAFAGKPAAVVGTSPGAAGSAMAQQHLRNVITALDMPLLPQPEVFLQFKEGLIGEDGSIASEGTAKFLGGFVDRFIDWIAAHRG